MSGQKRVKEKFYEIGVIQSLRKKLDCKLEGNTILVLSNQAKMKRHDLGNGSWGKINYLEKIHGYTVVITAKF